MDAKRAFAMRRALHVAARGCLALVVIGLLASLAASGFAGLNTGKAAEPVHIRYFYVGSCDSCEPETIQSLTDAFRAAAASIPGKTFSLELINSFRPDGFDALVEAFDQHGIPKRDRADAAVFADSGCLIGSDAIAAGLTDFLSTAENAAPAAVTPSTATDAGVQLVKGGATPTVVFFYVTACADCEAMRKALQALPDQVNVIEHNIADGEALALYPAYVAAYHVPESRQLLPIAFAGEHFYNAKEAAQGALLAAVQQGGAVHTLVPAPAEAVPQNVRGLSR